MDVIKSVQSIHGRETGNSIVLRCDGHVLINNVEVVGAELLSVGKIENGKETQVTITFPADSLVIAHNATLDNKLDAIVSRSQEHCQL